MTGPWSPTEYDIADVSAVQALANGNASPEQQRRALAWIVEMAAGYYDLSFRPGVDGQRDTDFAEGKRFVGAQVVKLTKLNIAALKHNKQADSHEPKE